MTFQKGDMCRKYTKYLFLLAMNKMLYKNKLIEFDVYIKTEKMLNKLK